MLQWLSSVQRWGTMWYIDNRRIMCLFCWTLWIRRQIVLQRGILIYPWALWSKPLLANFSCLILMEYSLNANGNLHFSVFIYFPIWEWLEDIGRLPFLMKLFITGWFTCLILLIQFPYCCSRSYPYLAFNNLLVIHQSFCYRSRLIPELCGLSVY